MNQLDLEEVLQRARKRNLDEHPGAWPKVVVVRADFEHDGWKYLKGEEHELPQDIAKELATTGQIEIARGGWCDVSQVKRIGKEMLYAYRSWQVGSPVSSGPKDPYADTMVRVRLNKSQQVVVGARLRPGDEFFLPYSELSKFEFDLEDDPNQNWIKTLTILSDQE